MKILHVLDHSIPLHSGYTFRTRAILQQQQAFGWQTFHLTGAKQGPAPAQEVVDGLSFFRTPPLSAMMAKTPILNQIRVISGLKKRLDEVCRLVQPDIIHAHSPALNGKAAIHVGQKRNIPVVYEIRAFWEDAAVSHGTSTENGYRYRLTKALETHVVQRASAVTVICEGLKQDIISRGIPASKLTVIPNAVDLNQFLDIPPQNTELRDQLGLKARIVLGFIGSFYEYEGLDLLVEAIPKIRESHPNVVLLLVGGGQQLDLLKQKVERLCLHEHVIFVGRVPHEQVTQYYQLVDIFVYPRVNMRLTNLVTPLKPLEAMAQEKLVLASDVGGHQELIRDNENGYLFKAGDINSLTQRVSDLIQAKQQWPALKQQGKDYVVSERNWQNSVERYRDVYTRLLS